MAEPRQSQQDREQRVRPEVERGSSLSRSAPSSQALGRRSFWNDPFALMRNMQQEMDQLFNTFGFGPLTSIGRDRGLSSASSLSSSSMWSPQIDMFERNGKLIVRADLPGLSKDDVHVEFQDDHLILSGQRTEEKEENREGFFHSERSYGSFYRSLPLPDGASPEKAKATFKNGVLEVELDAPKQKPSGQRIEVREG